MSTTFRLGLLTVLFRNASPRWTLPWTGGDLHFASQWSKRVRKVRPPTVTTSSLLLPFDFDLFDVLLRSFDFEPDRDVLRSVLLLSLDFVLLLLDFGLTFSFCVLSPDFFLLVLDDLSPSVDLLLLPSADRRVLLDLGLRVVLCSPSTLTTVSDISLF